MKRQINLYIAIIGVIIFLMNGSVNAQSGKTLNVNIPFEFMIGGEIFEAGDYKIKRLNPQKRSMLVLQDNDGKNKKIFLTNNVKAKERVDNPGVTFIKYEDSYFLAEIWTGNTKSGLTVLQSKAERKMEQTAKLNKRKFTIAASVQ